MYVCPKCKTRYDTHALDSCPHCRLPSPLPVFCENEDCKAELEPDARFCPKCQARTACGRKVDQALGLE